MGCEPTTPLAAPDRQMIIDVAVRAHHLIAKQLGRAFISVPALDMLLDLYISDTSRSKSLTSLCGASRAPTRTALRTIKRMVEHGLLVTSPDPDDARRTNVKLTDKSMALLDSYFDRLTNFLTEAMRR